MTVLGVAECRTKKSLADRAVPKSSANSPTHNPIGSPCQTCGKPRVAHHVKHVAVGEPCAVVTPHGTLCKLPARCHIKRAPSGARTDKGAPLYVGLDGEGYGRNPHHYAMMGAASSDGEHKWNLSPAQGPALRTAECLDFILSLPERAKIFMFSFNYDITKIISDLPAESIALLVRAERRPRAPGKGFGPRPIRWKGYKLNWEGSKFTVQRGAKVRVIWDLFKFYQSSFMNALRLWKIGDPETLGIIEKMKQQRGDFDKTWGSVEGRKEILRYCLLECELLGQLAIKLIQAHDAVGLKLHRVFHGAGTTGALILDKMRIRECNRFTPETMRAPVAAAFFGGRFEHSVIGPIPAVIHSYDISSAYPYRITFLPCLDHGTWTLTTRRKDIDKATAALIRYKLRAPKDRRNWAPFPFRDRDGNICFPSASDGGWVYKDEYLSGERLFPNVQFQEAWIYRTECKCQPFKAIPEYYRERVRIGKEGPGIVLKLGPNSVYGKLAQSIGTNPPYQCWIWAGMITSGCRAQILDMMALHKNLNNLLAIATDGIYTREKLATPEPLDTGTSWIPCDTPKPKDVQETPGIYRKQADGSYLVNKPLGGWEAKEVRGNGVFFARPGIYFESGLKPTEMLNIVRARGMGRANLIRHAAGFIKAWDDGQPEYRVPQEVSRFCGAKTSTHFNRANGWTRAEYYGQWVNRPLTLTFDPMPKREPIIDRVPGTKYGTLRLRDMRGQGESAAYDRATHMNSEDSVMMREAAQEMLEQPDADFADFGGEEGGN
jgi:DNA polymerase type B, organellar and viral